MDRVFVPSRLRRPAPPRHALARPRLTQRLNEGLDHPLVLVSAPAGYGKTTLVSDWVGQCRLPTAWLSLDDEDTDVSAIMSYVTAAVESVYPEACLGTRSLLRPVTSPPALAIADQFLSDLCGIEGDLVLVLDDCHLVHDMGFYLILDRLLRHPPSHLHLVVVTRHDPPLSLAALRARGSVMELRIADLRFTRDETSRLLHQLTGWRPEGATLAVLEEALEGWPVGLQLLIRALQGPSTNAEEVVRAMRSSVRPAAEYLAAELLATVPAAVRHLLLVTAPLDRFCAPLVDALCAETTPTDEAPGSRAERRELDGAQFVDYLESRDLFVFPLDDEGIWYRYHGILRAILRQYLAKEYDQAARDALHHRAATWYEQHDYVDQALHHATMVADWGRAASIVRRARVAAVNREDWASLRRWLDRLPRDMVSTSPELLVARALELQNAQQLARVDELVDQAETLSRSHDWVPSPEERRVLDAEIATLRCNSSYWRADGDGCRAAAERALRSAPDKLTFLRGAATLFLGLGRQMAGHKVEARALLRAALADAAQEPPSYQARVLLGIAMVSWADADLDDAAAAARRLAALGEEQGLPASLGWADFLLGAIAYVRGDVTTAIPRFSAIVARPFATHLMVELHAHFGLALAHWALGRREESIRWADRATAWSLERGMPGALELAEAFRARLALAVGQRASAITWAANRPPPVFTVPLAMIEDPVLTWIQVQLARPGGVGLDPAAEALAAHQDLCVTAHATLRLIQLHALDALVLNARGRRGPALDVLDQALRLAEPGGIVRPLLDLRPSLLPLLQLFAARSGSDGYVHRVLGTASDAAHTASGRTARPEAADGLPVDPLTPRETEVLALLEERYSNQEIAARLVISPVTVKTHAHSIYSKLNARNRRDAVARARALGLLTDD